MAIVIYYQWLKASERLEMTQWWRIELKHAIVKFDSLPSRSLHAHVMHILMQVLLKNCLCSLRFCVCSWVKKVTVAYCSTRYPYVKLWPHCPGPNCPKSKSKWFAHSILHSGWLSAILWRVLGAKSLSCFQKTSLPYIRYCVGNRK